MKYYYLTEAQLKDLLNTAMVSSHLINRTRDDIEAQKEQIIDEILNSRQWMLSLVDRTEYDERIK